MRERPDWTSCLLGGTVQRPAACRPSPLNPAHVHGGKEGIFHILPAVSDPSFTSDGKWSGTLCCLRRRAGPQISDYQVLFVCSPPPSGRLRNGGPGSGGHASLGAGTAGSQEGGLRPASESLPPDHSCNSHEDAQGVGSQANRLGPHYAVGSQLPWFLRLSEVRGAPDVGEFDPGQHLSFADVSADNPQNPRIVAVCIKRSKTDLFRQGVTIYVGKTDMPLCPVAAMLAYMAMRGPVDGPLFRFRSEEALTCQRLVMVGKGRPQAGRVRGTQFFNWCGNYGSGLWNLCGYHQDAKSVEEPGVPTVREAAEKAAGQH